MHLKYTQSNESELELIKPLWEKLKSHHSDVSKYFSNEMAIVSFDNRIKSLKEKAKKGSMLLIQAIDLRSNKLIGYCICTIVGQDAEIDSIYVEQDYRGKKIGNNLMQNALNWINKHGSNNIKIVVLYGNERALKFYEKFGFYPRGYVLKKWT